jgi:hypothetical protein
MKRAPRDRELLEALGGSVDGREVIEVKRGPYRYSTSAPLEEVRMATTGGGEAVFILKDLDRQRLVGDARMSKPQRLYEPRREIETYRCVIGPAGIGPRCYASVSREQPPHHWLLIEKVPGVELWQVGDLALWEAVAEWVGRMHARFRGQATELRRANPHLLEHTDEWYGSWRDRALIALRKSGDPRAADLAQALAGYDGVASALAALPQTLIHGELYPANIIVVRDSQPPAVYPVDWEMAATGPGAIDLAALLSGWNAASAGRLAAAYVRGTTDASARKAEGLSNIDLDIDRARLHLALQWLGWAEGWTAPPEHARDWLGEALTLARRLHLPGGN